jgi:hypothetical protein
MENVRNLWPFDTFCVHLLYNFHILVCFAKKNLAIPDLSALYGGLQVSALMKPLVANGTFLASRPG